MKVIDHNFFSNQFESKPIENMLSMMFNNEVESSKRINLVASENVLSPFAKLPFILDFHTRYFLDDKNRFGKWYFPGGKAIGEIEEEILLPLLSELSGAKYVNIRPISGMNCMTIALAGLTKPGDTILSVPFDYGGHISTPVIAEQFGLDVVDIPFLNTYDIDLDRLKKILTEKKPRLIYIDQSTFLFPIDPQPIRELIDQYSPKTVVHYDSSHTNGLILGQAMFNPLDRGAHVFGGSTHKTLAGPHKGFLATNCSTIAKKIQDKSYHFVSHHHPSSSLSLAITLLELKHCGGAEYARQIICNAKIFAESLSKHNFYVAGEERGFTGAHQVWSYPQGEEGNGELQTYLDRLLRRGIVPSRFDSLPGINQPSFRMSLAEVTRYGASAEDIESIANIMAELVHSDTLTDTSQSRLLFLHEKLSRVKFCFTEHDIDDLDLLKFVGA